jgi:hypothetical protein
MSPPNGLSPATTSPCVRKSSNPPIQEHSPGLPKAINCLREPINCLREPINCLREPINCLREPINCLREPIDCLRGPINCLSGALHIYSSFSPSLCAGWGVNVQDSSRDVAGERPHGFLDEIVLVYGLSCGITDHESERRPCGRVGRNRGFSLATIGLSSGDSTLQFREVMGFSPHLDAKEPARR